MADNVDITAGSGTTIATDDCTTGQVQLVKLAYSADGVRTHAPVDADGVLVNLGANNDVSLNAGSNNIGDVDVLSIAAGDNNIGNVDIVTVPAPLSTTGGGTEATALRVTVASDSTGVLSVDDNGAALTVDNAGTFATQENGSALTALQLIDDCVFADDAAFTVGTSKVTAVGGLAVAHGSAPDAADALDVGALLTNRHRVQFTIGGHPNVVSYGMSITTAVTNAIIGPTQGAGAKFVVTGITVTADNANTVFPSVVIGFGTASTPAFAGTPGTLKVIAGHPGVPAGGGFSRGDGSGMLGVGADDEEVRITTVGNVTGLYVVLTGYTIES